MPRPKYDPANRKTFVEGAAARAGETDLMKRLGVVDADEEAAEAARRAKKERIAQQARDMQGK